MSVHETIDVALFGDEVERSLHTAFSYDTLRSPHGQQRLRRSSADVHALDAKLTEAIKRGWGMVGEHLSGRAPSIRFCLTVCGVAYFKAWVWVLPIGRLFDESEPQREVIDQLRLIRSLAPETLGLVWLTPSPRITQFELNRAPQKVKELLRDLGMERAVEVVLPSQGVAELISLLTRWGQGQLSVPDLTLQGSPRDPRSELIAEMNRRLLHRPRLSEISAQRELLSLDELVPVLNGSYEGVDRQVWKTSFPYYICQTLMTKALFNYLMDIEVSDEPPRLIMDLPYLRPPVREVNLREPASRVSWLTATQACNALSIAHELSPYYKYERPDGSLCEADTQIDNELFEEGGWAVYADQTASGSFRLPKSDEWCYAAAARHPHPYAGGDDPEPFAWSAHNSGSKLHAVASLLPNRWGLYDMNGLLWEWCEDGPSDEQTKRSPKWGSRAKMTLLCDAPTQAKWLLGGSWANHPWVFPIGERLSEFPTYEDDFMGVRVVRGIQKSPTKAKAKAKADD